MHFWRKLIYHEKFRRKAKGGRTNGPPERSSYLEKMKIRISIYFEIKDSEMFGGVGSIGYLIKIWENCGIKIKGFSRKRKI